ncbi:MAG TPA: amidohydrolase family protein [Mycobacteriales bacterium]|nr:amidohydrolase family protein [Mycobacteriales bacterium]
MSKVGIVSVDGHIKAAQQTYRDYLDPRHREAYDEWSASASASGGRDAGNIQAEIPDEAQWDLSRRLTDLESQGVIAEVLFPNGIPFQHNAFEDAGRAEDPALSRAGIDAYNRWLVDFCAQAPNRLKGQAIVRFDDIDRAVLDVHWAKEHGLGGIMMPGLYPGDRYFFDPALDPIWAAVEETGLPLSQHGGAGAPTYTPAGLAAILTLAYEHAFFSGRSLWQMIVGGVFDRFPGIRIAFIETEVRWIGPALALFDSRVEMGDDWMEFAAYLERERAFARKPSEYWESNCYAGISPFHPNQLPLEKLRAEGTLAPGEFAIRSTNAMFGVDFPHFESIYPATDEQVAALTGQGSLTRQDIRAVLCDNAAQLYGIDLVELAPIIDRVGVDLGPDR